MQPTILIPRIADAPVSAAEIVSVMDNAHLPFIPVAHSCWAESFPYKPQVEVRLAHTGSHLLIHYRVSEACVRAVASYDNGNVWEDSCCELFLSPTDNGTYYNIECNAAGTMLIGAGAARANRERANQETIYIRTDNIQNTAVQQDEEPRMELLDVLLGLIDVFHIGK